MFKESFHTHTYYCDGKNSPEEMVAAAAEKGFTAIGFSGHAYIKDFFCDWCMTPEKTGKYISDISILKEKYKDIINIYTGTELDYCCTEVPGEYDFTIGSVHYIVKEGNCLSIDHSGKTQTDDVNRYYGGSFGAYAAEYFSLVADVLNKFGSDIIGHFDLVAKFNEDDCLFDSKDRLYVNAWHDAVDALIPYGKPFEINTGAIARGYRKTPYPALDIAEYIHSKGGFFVLTSDCHDKDYLDCGYEDAMKLYSKFNIVSFEEILRPDSSAV